MAVALDYPLSIRSLRVWFLSQVFVAWFAMGGIEFVLMARGEYAYLTSSNVELTHLPSLCPLLSASVGQRRVFCIGAWTVPGDLGWLGGVTAE